MFAFSKKQTDTIVFSTMYIRVVTKQNTVHESYISFKNFWIGHSAGYLSNTEDGDPAGTCKKVKKKLHAHKINITRTFVALPLSTR